MKTPKEAFPAIADALSSLGSHEIYDVEYIKKKLTDAGYLDRMPEGMSRSDMWDSIENRGLGGELSKKEVRYYGGYQASNFVVSVLGVKAAEKMGRGSQHRANIEALQSVE